MKIIDDKTLDAFRCWADTFKTQRDMAKAMGCSTKHVNAILNGHVRFVRDSLWDQIAPQIKPFIAPEDNKRIFLKENVHLLTDQEVDELILRIVSRGQRDRLDE